MFKDYKYSAISKMNFTLFFRYLLLSTSNIRMSEGTFCRVEVHMVMNVQNAVSIIVKEFFVTIT